MKNKPTKKVFKRHAKLDFLFIALLKLIEQRFLLYGLDEENLKQYFTHALNNIFSTAMFAKIRNCLSHEIKPEIFIRTTLRQAFLDYVLQYTEDEIQLYFDSQIKKARQETAIEELMTELKTLSLKANCLIQECKSFDKPSKQVLLKHSNAHWEKLISKANWSRSFLGNMAVFNKSNNLLFALLFFIGTQYFTKQTMSKLYYPIVGSLLSLDKNPNWDPETWIEDDLHQTSTLVIFSAVLCSIIAAQKIYTGLSGAPIKKLDKLLNTAAEEYLKAHPPVAHEAQQRNILAEIIPIKFRQKSPQQTTSDSTLKDHIKKKVRPLKRWQLPAATQTPTLETKHKAPSRQKQAEEVTINGHRYVQIHNPHGIPTGAFFKRPASPTHKQIKSAFNLVLKDPTLYPANYKGQAGLKLLGHGEHVKFPDCSAKVKFFDRELNSTRLGVSARPPTLEEDQVLTNCTQVLTARLDRTVKK